MPQPPLTATQWFEKAYDDHVNKKEYYDAIVAYTKAIELDPQCAKAYNNRGLAYQYKTAKDLAMADYNKAIELNPQYANAYYNRGLLYDSQVKEDLAIADFTQAIALNPNDADYYMGRAAAHEWNGAQYRLAIDDYNQVLMMDPNNQKAYVEKRRIINYGSGGVYAYYDSNIRDTSYNPFRR